jgi:ribosomal 50S subunit-recycling heat shock protein
MRIDKYLKLTRIIKRRQISKEIIDQGRVKVNGKVVKPAAIIKNGDILDIDLSKTLVTVQIIESDEKLVKKSPDGSYKILREVKHEVKPE